LWTSVGEPGGNPLYVKTINIKSTEPTAKTNSSFTYREEDKRLIANNIPYPAGYRKGARRPP
jgi:hypothetical protein